MSIHISAEKGEIAKVLLQPGDPLRAQYIARREAFFIIPVFIKVRRSPLVQAEWVFQASASILLSYSQSMKWIPSSESEPVGPILPT